MELIKESFPDGTKIGDWFYSFNPDEENLGKEYVVTDYGVKADGSIQTEKLQTLIDKISNDGGGVMVVPKGTFLTGALFFKKGVNLLVQKDGVIKGSDDISDYPIIKTRIEGETCLYFPALINVDGVDGFTMKGDGVIDGNGERAWKAFWIRRQWNPDCTNKDEQRPRLVYISNSKNVTVKGLTLKNSHFWTNHIYKCEKVRFIDCKIRAPRSLAPSSDAIDIDVCTDVHIKGCIISVNDDAIVLKGGKGPFADTDKDNGSNERVIVEDCVIEYAHACLTCGSESVHNKNVIVKNINVINAGRCLWLKMRPDTPQKYELISLENINGVMDNFIVVAPWTQFFDLKGREDKPISVAKNIKIKDCDVKCKIFFNVQKADEQYLLSDFTLENINATAEKFGTDYSVVKNVTVNNVNIKK
ncbi:MAG: exopolygalacturonase [Clostridia bacterium]|nr:exopolygalacturonase [Clostridia bacterium]